jgi:dolichol-phosphate mannosyltransferase
MIELAIVVPTFNEKQNIRELVSRLENVLNGVGWEVIFVDDDSPDCTSDVIRCLAQSKPYVRCLQRIGRRGLSRAVIEGILATAAPYVAVMDADLQHDEKILPQMLERIRTGDVDLVVGSRYCIGGSICQWDPSRAMMSRLATKLSRLVVRDQITDPMSGYFMVRRGAFQKVIRNLSGEGYKILLDLFASSPVRLRYAELPYNFRNRVAGESKLDSAVLWGYLLLITDKLVGHIVPVRFVMFSLVGLSGVMIHFLALWVTHKLIGADFSVSQLTATFMAMTSNYSINNILTYRDRRRRGSRYFTGLLIFYCICLTGVVANVGVASFVFRQDYTWWVAGGAGALVAVVWNYGASAIFTWGRQ